MSLLMKGGFSQLPQKDGTHRSIFTLSAKFCLQELRSSEQFLEGRKEPWNFESKIMLKILHNRLFNISIKTGRFFFQKVNTRGHAN